MPFVANLPFSPWLNAAKREIKEPKNSSGRKMINSKSPKGLWDDCLEFELYTHSNITHCMYKHDWEVPKTVITGEIFDISQFCQFKWLEWVMF